MKQKIIKSLIVGLIFVLGLSTLAFADDMNMNKGTEKKVDGIGIALSFKKDKVKTGENDIMITLSDSSGQSISNATVNAAAEMDKSMSMDMKDKKPIAIAFKNGDDKGQYMGTVNFTDKGKWIVKATINVQGQEKNMDFDVDVASAGPNWGIIGGFSGVIALIIIIAAVKKKQSVKA